MLASLTGLLLTLVVKDRRLFLSHHLILKYLIGIQMTYLPLELSFPGILMVKVQDDLSKTELHSHVHS